MEVLLAELRAAFVLIAMKLQWKGQRSLGPASVWRDVFGAIWFGRFHRRQSVLGFGFSILRRI
jgi:hypothetical protein